MIVSPPSAVTAQLTVAVAVWSKTFVVVVSVGVSASAVIVPVVAPVVDARL